MKLPRSPRGGYLLMLLTILSGAMMRVSAENPPSTARTTILHDGRNWTLVPKDALLFLPAAMTRYVNAKPVGTLMPWREFLARNHAWLATDEVSFDQAAGNETIPSKRITSLSKQEKIVVAVQMHGPVSVRVENAATP